MRKYKRLIALILIVFVCLFCIIALIIHHKSQEPMNYVASKYDFDIDDIKFEGYTPKLLKNNSSTNPLPLPDFYYTPQRWRFKYKNKSFYVDCVGDNFFDDYQLEDLSKWCTQYLRQNVDENIVGTEINSSYIYDIASSNTENGKLLQESDAENYLKNQCIVIRILYNGGNEEKENKTDEIKRKLSELGVGTRTIFVQFTDGEKAEFKKVQESDYNGYKYTLYTFV